MYYSIRIGVMKKHRMYNNEKLSKFFIFWKIMLRE